jgi:acyl-CoA synthetase (AMP-forming)/AMP-acid ligase II
VSVLGRTLREAADRFGDRGALVHHDRRMTYAEVDTATDELAAGLAQRGVRAGQLIALALPNGLEYVLAFTALARLDAVVTGLNPRFTKAERDKVLEQAQPDLVIVSPSVAGEIPAAYPPLVCPTEGGDTPVGQVWGEVPIPGGSAPAGSDRADLALPETVVFTSGTTGVPKGALFAGSQIAAIAAFDTGGAWGTGGAQLVATGLPHVGFMTKLAGYFQLGATLHILDRWRAADALRVLAQERVPYIGGVAAQVSLLMHHPDFATYDWSAVKGLIVGAGPSPAALVREAQAKFGAGYSVRYSLTESGGIGTLTAFDAPESETLGSVGRPRPGTQIEIRDPESDRPLGPGEMGRVCVSSPSVMAGYWRDPQATAEALDGNGWLRTGDLGHIGTDGLLRITGRIGDMYIRGGYNVYSLEVEGVLLDHPGVASVAIAPRPSDVMGEIGVAVVVPAAGTTEPTLDELRAFAGEQLAAYKLPEAIMLVDELPLTTMDKLDRRALKALVSEGADGPPV